MKNLPKKLRTSRINYLHRVRAVQEAYQEHYVEDVPLTAIYRRYIQPKYFISLPTLREYLTINVSQELKKLSQHD